MKILPLLMLILCVAALSCARKEEVQPVAPPAVAKVADLAASLYASLGGDSGSQKLDLVSVQQSSDGNWWFSFYPPQANGMYVPDSDISIEVDPVTMKLRASNMAFSIHSKGAKIVTGGPREYATLDELERIWRGEAHP